MINDTNIADLLRSLRDETTTLVREELSLARTEVSEKVALFTRNLSYLAIGGIIGGSAFLLMLIGISNLLAEWFAGRGMNPGTSLFLGFLIMAILVSLLSTSLIAKSLKTLSTSSFRPDRTVRSLQKDKQWAQEQIS